MYALTAVPLPPNSTLNDPAPIASPNNPIISDDILRYGMLAFLIMAGLAFLCFLYRRIKHYIVASRNRALPRKISKLLAYNIVICRDGYIPNKRGQLLLSPDSVVGVLKIDDEWCTCINIQTGTIGLVPKACVAGLKD